MKNLSKATRAAQQAALRDGLARIYDRSAVLSLGGKKVRVGTLLDALDALRADRERTAAARAAWLAAAAAEKERQASLSPLLTRLCGLLRVLLSDEELAACGLVRRQRRALSPDERTAAVAKFRATRQAEGIRGARQKRVAAARAVIEDAYGRRGPGSRK